MLGEAHAVSNENSPINPNTKQRERIVIPLNSFLMAFPREGFFSISGEAIFAS